MLDGNGVRMSGVEQYWLYVAGRKGELLQGRARYVYYADSIYQTGKLYEELDGGKHHPSARMGKGAGGEGE